MDHDAERQNLTSLNQENPATDKKQNKRIVAVIVIIVAVVVVVMIFIGAVGVLNLKFMNELKKEGDDSKTVQIVELVQSDRVKNAASMCMATTSRTPELSSNGYVTIKSYSANGRNFIREGIQFNRFTGHFNITKDGLYTINSKIAVRIYPSQMLKIYKQSIKLLDNKGNEEELATRIEDTHCDDITSTKPCYFSYLAAQQALKKGDKIFVEAGKIADSVGTIVMDGTSSCIDIRRIGS